jgi:serine O-acetyltransferase
VSKIIFKIKSLFLVFHYLVFYLSRAKKLISEDLRVWQNEFMHSKKRKVDLGYLLIHYPQFRSIFYHRLKKDKRFIIRVLRRISSILFKPLFSLLITTEKIGGGLFIQHGFCTIISAKKIGRNCWINQGVTLGYTNVTDAPVIGDNVKIYAGAKILGAINIGNNCIVGANSVVVKDVSDNTVVGGIPAKTLKKLNA